MIVKKMKCKQDKAKALHVHHTVDYVTGQTNIDDKILHTEFVNVLATEYEDAKAEMIQLAIQSPSNCKNPLHHMMISFRKSEAPTLEQSRSCVKIMLTELGYQDCQHVFSVHQDTDNYHIHIAVNRVDPATKRVHWNFRDTDLMHKALARIEKEQGWSREKNALFAQVDDNIVPTRNVEELTKVKIPQEARAMELRTGEQSAARLAAEEALSILLTSESWADVHRQLAEKGFEYKPKGGGAVLVAHIDGEQIQVKPSDLHKKAALKGMQDRLGQFEALAVEIVDRRAEPLPDVPREAFDQYRTEKSGAKQTAASIYEEHEQMKAALHEERKALLEQIKNSDWTGKGLVLAAFQKAAKEHHQEQLQSLAERYKEKIEKAKHISDKVTDFETWVALKCPQHSEQVKQAIDSSTTRVELKIDQPLTGEAAVKYDAFRRYHDAVGAERYRVTTRGIDKNGEKIAYILDRDKDGISRGYEANLVYKSLPKMLRFAAKEEHLYFTPLSNKMHHILVDDLTQERLQQMKRDGYNPSVVLESSPGNYQAIINVPKLGNDPARDKEIANKISEGLNKTYGDVNLSGAIHPHRVPDFPNPKEKNRQKDGSFPLTRLVSAEGKPCEKLWSFSHYVNDHLNYLAFKAASTAKKKNQVVQTTQAQDQGQRQGEAQTTQQRHFADVYRAHKQASMRLAALHESDANMSRIDAMVAVRLRGTGHTEAEVAAILAAGAPEGRGNAHEWNQYAAATAAHAFSPENTLKLQKYAPYIKQWRSIERQAGGVATHIKAEEQRKSQERARQQEQQRKQTEQQRQLQQQEAMRNATVITPKPVIINNPGGTGQGQAPR